MRFSEKSGVGNAPLDMFDERRVDIELEWLRLFVESSSNVGKEVEGMRPVSKQEERYNLPEHVDGCESTMSDL